MFLEMIKSEGISHLSYILGDGQTAAVIDPRRDSDVYIDIAHKNGTRITHIFETHRNEDYVIGSTDLARRTGAEIYHGSSDVMQFKYGNFVSDDDEFEFGDIRLKVIETPGHTLESISIAVSDTGFSEQPIAVFTGDTLFVGDVGRTDFYPDKPEEVAGLLYDSIHEKLLPLGDHVILYPAHGAGSVCGSGMASREYSTLGYERQFNPRLQMSREEFVKYKVKEHHYQPPYFQRMEDENQNGAKPLQELPRPVPMSVDEFAHAMEKGMQVLDIRSAESIAGAFVPGSLGIPLEMVSAFAGWYLSYDRPIGLVADDAADVDKAVKYLLRLGYTDIKGYLQGSLVAWEVSGRDYDSIPAVYAGVIKQRMSDEVNYTLLDVRSLEEYQSGHLPDSKHIYVGELARRTDELSDDRPVTTFCGSGLRAIIAASLLRRAGVENVEVCLGSMAACQKIGCKTVEDRQAA